MLLQVGSRGPNVTKLQADLNSIYSRDFPQLRTDGIFGPKTKEWVCKFQRSNHLVVDGIVGPKTLGKMQQTGGSPGAPPAAPGIPSIPSAPATGPARFSQEMKEEFVKKGKSSLFNEFLADLENNTIPGWKVFLGIIGRAEDARVLARFWVELRAIGLTGPQLRTVLAQTIRLNKDALVFFDVVTKPGGKFARALGFAGSAANVAGIITTGIECVLHARRGDYSVIPAEIYKFYMGKAVPWAAIIEGIGSLLDGVVPEETRKSSLLFRIMRGFDPIGLGASGVDAMGSIVLTAFEMVQKGEINADIAMPRLQRLVSRMKQGPTNIFVELGENCGDALYELSETGIDFEAIMRYSWMELSEWVSE